jgi:protein-S-isoprenylcysteine O-methyltransferase Ste14
MVALLVVTTIAWLALEASSTTEEPPARWSRGHAGALATGVTLFAVQAIAIAEHVARGTSGSLAGLALIAGGVGLRIAAIRALGDDFVSTSTAPSRVVTTGLYRWMRHPSELGLVAAAAGATVLLGSPAAAAVALVGLVPLSALRCAAEDRVLARAAVAPAAAAQRSPLEDSGAQPRGLSSRSRKSTVAW